MKIQELLATFAVLFLVVLSAQGQGSFQNLDFESANLSNPSGLDSDVPITNALPGWSASIGGVPVTQIWANVVSGGQATIDVPGPGWHTFNPGIIDGNYTVFLQAFNPGQGNVSLWQNGMVPANAESLQFKAWNAPSANEVFSVSFAGNNLSTVVFGSGESASGQGYTTYGVNIAPYADQTGQLEFTAFGGQGPNFMLLDDITFSTNTVTPEPNTLSLLLISGVAFGVGHWRVKRK